jgi:GNAT superfamily N-acetyltransferase
VTEPRLRAATREDIDAIDGILRASDTPPPGEPPLPPHSQDTYLQYLITHGSAAVVELDAALIGFGATSFNGRVTHLADLFVTPEHQGRGHGGRLVAAVFGERRPRTTFSSDDPRAMPLYVRAGMMPLWPNIYISGVPARLPVADGVSVEPSTYEQVAALDAEWGRVDRTNAIDYWRTLPDGRPYVVSRGGRPVAIVVGRRRFNGYGRWVDRARVAPGESPVLPLLAGMRRAAEGGNLIGACVPGPSPLLPVLLGAGFRIRDRDVYMASDASLLDPTLELLNTGIL